MITLSQRWLKELADKPETGTRFDQVAVVEGRITETRRQSDIPRKWNFNAERQ